MELFSYLGYDGGKTQFILKHLRDGCKQEVTIKQLNDILESGVGVTYYNEAVKPVKDSKNAKYMLLDTQMTFRLKNLVASNAFVSIVCVKNRWTAGYVGTEEELLESIRLHETNLTESYMGQMEPSEVVNTKVNRVTCSGDIMAISKEISDIIIDGSSFWSDENIYKIIKSRVDIIEECISASSEAGETGNAFYYMNKEKNKILFSTGLIDDMFNYIVLAATVNRSSNSVKLEKFRLITGENALKTEGFEAKSLMYVNCNWASTMLIGSQWKSVVINTNNREAMNHCVIERWERASGKTAEALSVRGMQRKVKESIDMCLGLQACDVNIVAPYFMSGDRKIGYLFPIYLSDKPDLSKPNAALAVKLDEETLVGEMLTLLDIEMAHLDVFTVAPNFCNIWINRGCGKGE